MSSKSSASLGRRRLDPGPAVADLRLRRAVRRRERREAAGHRVERLFHRGAPADRLRRDDDVLQARRGDAAGEHGGEGAREREGRPGCRRASPAARAGDGRRRGASAASDRAGRGAQCAGAGRGPGFVLRAPGGDGAISDDASSYRGRVRAVDAAERDGDDRVDDQASRIAPPRRSRGLRERKGRRGRRECVEGDLFPEALRVRQHGLHRGLAQSYEHPVRRTGAPDGESHEQWVQRNDHRGAGDSDLRRRRSRSGPRIKPRIVSTARTPSCGIPASSRSGRSSSRTTPCARASRPSRLHGHGRALPRRRSTQR